MEAMATETVCPKCGGTGWIIVERADVSRRRARAIAASGTRRAHGGPGADPAALPEASFENFVVPGPENPIARRELTNVLLAVKNFVRDFPMSAVPDCC